MATDGVTGSPLMRGDRAIGRFVPALPSCSPIASTSRAGGPAVCSRPVRPRTKSRCRRSPRPLIRSRDRRPGDLSHGLGWRRGRSAWGSRTLVWSSCRGRLPETSSCRPRRYVRTRTQEGRRSAKNVRRACRGLEAGRRRSMTRSGRPPCSCPEAGGARPPPRTTRDAAIAVGADAAPRPSRCPSLASVDGPSVPGPIGLGHVGMVHVRGCLRRGALEV